MFLKVNQNIIIDITNHDKSCKSVVADISENEILIGVPMDRGIIGLLSERTKLEISFFKKDNKYKFETEVIGRKKDNIPLFRITKPKKEHIVKVQDRENFRVKTNLQLILNDTKLNTVNISAGGALISCVVDIDLQEGEEVSGTIVIPGLQNQIHDIIPFEGVIRRIDLLENQDRKHVAIEFTNMDKQAQTKVIQYCFEKQRQMRLKERNQ